MSILDQLSNSGFGSTANKDDSASNKDVMKGDTGDGPYEQFVECRHKDDFECRFKDVHGNCIYEACVFDDHHPPRVLLWYFKCVICDEEDSIKPEEMRVPFCHSCIQRMLRAEKLPHSCVFCGKTIHKPAKLMMSGICDECAGDLWSLIDFYRSRGKRGWKHTV